jgi:hypothetical protein
LSPPPPPWLGPLPTDDFEYVIVAVIGVTVAVQIRRRTSTFDIRALSSLLNDV